ncbi:MAG: Obg family GTPase CgtA [Dehalococcoidia bacterium]
MDYRKEVSVSGGAGGDGCVSFRREKYVPFGGPDGGDGGDGGSVIVVASRDVGDLSFMRRWSELRAGNGGRGRGWRKKGKNGEDLTIQVPVGTRVLCGTGHGLETELADLDAAGQEVVVARGGRGGVGNSRFATAVNQAPEVAGQGEAGEERCIVLELRPATDICIIGKPNSGKSTLLSAVTGARPEIASYPFTTREPVLGIISGDRDVFVVAEIPGLVAGAHLGKGLGNAFLRHAERTGVLILLLDGTSPNMMDDLSELEREIAEYGCGLARKPRIVAANKLDLPEAEEHVSRIRPELEALGMPVFYICASGGRGVPGLVGKAKEMAKKSGEAEQTDTPGQMAVFRPRPKK